MVNNSARFQKLLLSLRINMKISKDTYWIIDFDSTFVRVECMPELARISLAAHPDRAKIVREIETITDMGMNGEISFRESLSRRVRLLHANRYHIADLILKLKDQISLSILKQRDFVKSNNRSIYVITGGFKEFVVPIVAEFGIREDHVLANEFIYDTNGNIIGFDETNPLADAYGKARVVERLELGKDVIIIGDGMTDYEIKEKGFASQFVVFVENVNRPAAVAKADFVAKSFDDVMDFCLVEGQ
jgi:D-3-phosphoglycerate dehydrogenase